MSVHRAFLPMAAFAVTAWAFYVQLAFAPSERLSLGQKVFVSLMFLAMATFAMWLALSILFP